jgi:hypothetical protein
MVLEFWRSEILKVWLQYFAAGIAAIPGGVIYVVLLEHSRTEKTAFDISLAIAVGFGLVAWFGVGHVLRSHSPTQPHLATVPVIFGTAQIASPAQVSIGTGTVVIIHSVTPEVTRKTVVVDMAMVACAGA